MNIKYFNKIIKFIKNKNKTDNIIFETEYIEDLKAYTLKTNKGYSKLLNTKDVTNISLLLSIFNRLNEINDQDNRSKIIRLSDPIFIKSNNIISMQYETTRFYSNFTIKTTISLNDDGNYNFYKEGKFDFSDIDYYYLQDL